MRKPSIRRRSLHRITKKRADQGSEKIVAQSAELTIKDEVPNSRDD